MNNIFNISKYFGNSLMRTDRLNTLTRLNALSTIKFQDI